MLERRCKSAAATPTSMCHPRLITYTGSFSCVAGAVPDNEATFRSDMLPHAARETPTVAGKSNRLRNGVTVRKMNVTFAARARFFQPAATGAVFAAPREIAARRAAHRLAHCRRPAYAF